VSASGGVSVFTRRQSVTRRERLTPRREKSHGAPTFNYFYGCKFLPSVSFPPAPVLFPRLAAFRVREKASGTRHRLADSYSQHAPRTAPSSACALHRRCTSDPKNKRSTAWLLAASLACMVKAAAPYTLRDAIRLGILLAEDYDSADFTLTAYNSIT